MAQVLEDRVALVTGGSRGIGAAIVKRLAREGGAVALTYVSSPERAKGIVQEVEKLGGRALAIQADSGDAAAVKRAVDATVEHFKRLDILVNNAGVAVLKPIDELTLEDFDHVVAVNVRGVFAATQAAARHLGEGGRIINIGSVNADRVPFAGASVYAMSKSAVQGLTRGLARDFGARGITVNNVQPGPVDTDMNPAEGEFAESLKALMALPRYGSGDEIASLVAYLAGPEAAFITGASLTVDGGFGA